MSLKFIIFGGSGGPGIVATVRVSEVAASTLIGFTVRVSDEGATSTLLEDLITKKNTEIKENAQKTVVQMQIFFRLGDGGGKGTGRIFGDGGGRSRGDSSCGDFKPLVVMISGVVGIEMQTETDRLLLLLVTFDGLLHLRRVGDTEASEISGAFSRAMRRAPKFVDGKTASTVHYSRKNTSAPKM